MNVAMLVGTLDGPPEQRNDNAPVELKVETIKRFINRDGEPKEYKSWHKVKVWRDKPEVMALKEGQLVTVTGELEYGNYEKDGVKVYTFCVNASSVQTLGGDIQKPGASGGGFDKDDGVF